MVYLDIPSLTDSHPLAWRLRWAEIRRMRGTRASVDPRPTTALQRVSATDPALASVRATSVSFQPFSIMPLSQPQITAATEVINILCTTPAGPRAKRKLGEMFMDLVDKDDLPEYYEV